jgi:predicted RNase H-like nuclease (RuvC/YqgF family)
MAVGRVRQSEDSRIAQLERELVMERMRVKELRQQLAEMEGRLA